MKIVSSFIIAIVGGLALIGCAGAAPKASDFKPMTASFADSKWDGKIVPKSEVCKKFNTRAGDTPAIKLKNMSPSTTKVTLSFNDETAGHAFNFGGHGVLEYTLPSSGKTVVTIPSAPGQVKELPKGFLIERNFTSKAWDSGYGYLPPCSGGRGHTYSVDIKAYNANDELTGETKLNLGKY